MNIVVATDNNFVQHCIATLNSLLQNNQKGIKIYVLSEGLTEENLDILTNLVSSNGSYLSFIQINREKFNALPMPNLDFLSHISIATYFRLLIPDLLPQSVSKVIYLDCDIIIRKSIDDLWKTDIDNHAIGAVYQVSHDTISNAERLGYSESYGYFNAGVLLINVEFWRDHSISSKLIEFLNNKKEDILYHDQDALNGVLFDKCKKLPCKWNMLSIFFKKDTLKITDTIDGKIINDYIDDKDIMIIEYLNPTIIHFVSQPKPWKIKSSHPFTNEYYKYLHNTPWQYSTKPTQVLSYLYRILRKLILKFTHKEDSYL